MFEKYGTIIAISLHRGYCFVQYQTPEMAQAAADAENGRRVKQACLEVNIATITKDEARKLPRGGAALKPILRTTPNCRIFIENDHQRLYAAHFERSLKALGVTVDLTVWKDGIRKHKNPIEYHLAQLQRDKDSICAICVCEEDPKRKTATVHIFKNELEEHRNMPAVDALCLIAKQVEKLRKYDQPPPGRIGSIMRIIADGRMATLLEIEQVIEFLEEKREKLGGRKRVYQSDESTQKLKNSIAKLFGGSLGNSAPSEPTPRPPQRQQAPPPQRQHAPPPSAAYQEFEPLPDMPPSRRAPPPSYPSQNSYPPSRNYDSYGGSSGGANGAHYGASHNAPHSGYGQQQPSHGYHSQQHDLPPPPAPTGYQPPPAAPPSGNSLLPPPPMPSFGGSYDEYGEQF